MKSATVTIIVCSLTVILCSCAVTKKPPVVAGVEKDAVPPILLGSEMPEDHQEIETTACMECHQIEVDSVATATKRFLERPGALEQEALWDEIVTFFGGKQSCVLATAINNEPAVTTIDCALDPVNQVFYALSEKGTRKLGQIRTNPKVALEYHQPRDAKTKIFRCLQMKGEARTFSADDAQFAEGLRVFKPNLDEAIIRRGMDMTCFTPHEILFYDNLRKERGLNIFQLWER
jgi:nitroimidazol reductase NimA-like FMN-containing flavoprotein (pyridoxamine 5'-phosphate oxidase superfamily)